MILYFLVVALRNCVQTLNGGQEVAVDQFRTHFSCSSLSGGAEPSQANTAIVTIHIRSLQVPVDPAAVS